jgi:hypothetical protein
MIVFGLYEKYRLEIMPIVSKNDDVLLLSRRAPPRTVFLSEAAECSPRYFVGFVLLNL